MHSEYSIVFIHQITKSLQLYMNCSQRVVSPGLAAAGDDVKKIFGHPLVWAFADDSLGCCCRKAELSSFYQLKARGLKESSAICFERVPAPLLFSRL